MKNMSFTSTFVHYPSDGGEPENFTLSGSSRDESARRASLAYRNGDAGMTKAFATACMHAICLERDRISAEFRERFAGGAIVPAADTEAHADAMRCFATALTQIESGKMFAVNALFARQNAGLDQKE